MPATEYSERSNKMEETSALLFALDSNPSLGSKTAEILGIPLSKSKTKHFADGEVFSKPMESVSGKDIYVIQSTFPPVNERLMELLVFIDALRNANAKKITVFIPYYGYARQERIIDEGDPVSCILISSLLKGAGADKLYTVDLHSLKVLPSFKIETENLSAMQLFADSFKEKLSKANVAYNDVCVVSPDHGGIARAQAFAELLPGSSFAYADKHRPAPNKAKVLGINGDVRNKLCIVVDDIIDTAGTMSAVCEMLTKEGAKHTWVAATHGVFSGIALDRLHDAGVTMISMSDSIENASLTKNAPISVVTLAPIIAEAIKKDLGK